MNIDLLAQDLRRDEGVVPYAYQDSLGYWTIGVGRLIDKAKGGHISDAVINLMLAEDIDALARDLDEHLPWWRNLDEPRARALGNLRFQLGEVGLLKFHRFLTALEDGDFVTASAELGNSVLAKQTPERLARIQAVILGTP